MDAHTALTYLRKYYVHPEDMNADIRQLPVLLKGAVGLGTTLATAAVQAAPWEPAVKVVGVLLGLCISAATLVNIGYGIAIRRRKLALLERGKDVEE